MARIAPVRIVSKTNNTVSSDEMRDGPIPFKECALWNLRSFMVKPMASAKEKRRGWVGHEKNNALSVIRKLLYEDVLVLKHCNVHLLQHI